MSKEDRQLIDRFIQNQLTGFELKNFHDRLERDNDFRKSVSMQNLLFESIQESEDKRLADAIVKRIGYKKQTIPAGLKLILTFLIFTIAGIILWDYLGKDSTSNKRNHIFFNFPEKIIPGEETTSGAEVRKDAVSKTQRKTLTESIQSDDSITSNQEHKTNQNENPASKNGEIIEVRTDQMLVSMTFRPTLIDTLAYSGSTENAYSNTEKISAALNPAADLPANGISRLSEGVEVEFWVSPVNYSGYKLIRNKLILFGIEEPDAVKLYILKDQLWMKYGGDFYKLDARDSFSALRVSSSNPM